MKKAILLSLGAITGMILVWTLRPPKDSLENQSHLTTKNFQSEDIETRLQSYLLSLQGTQRLQLAELSHREVLSRTSRKKIFWDRLELPTVVVAVEIPVTYTYYVDLKKDWSVEMVNRNQLKVLLPPIMPNLPAADISNMKMSYEKTSFLRDEEAIGQNLVAELSSYLERQSHLNIPSIEETARSEIVNFITRWEGLKDFNGNISVEFKSRGKESSSLPTE